MKWLGLVGLCLVVFVGLIALVGASLPRGHVAARRAVIQRPPSEVFAALRDIGRAPEWRTDLKRVELLDSAGGRPRFREHGAHGSIAFEIVEEQKDARLVTRIADDSLPFGGTWTYELTPVARGTEIAITERGEVKNVFFRVLSRYAFSHHRTLEQYLRALGKRFGEDVTPI